MPNAKMYLELMDKDKGERFLAYLGWVTTCNIG